MDIERNVSGIHYGGLRNITKTSVSIESALTNMPFEYVSRVSS
jgi:hypothetical protein